MIFSRLLFSISPHAYKFLRSSGNNTLPHFDTIHRLYSKFPFSPLQEQHEENFLYYAKQKFSQTEKQERIVIK